jgi:DNA helicase-2/ATP-dependent DNA helicase PcrA
VPTPDEILDALDPEQRAVALAPIGPVVVRAGAGTGKTRAVTHRIAYLALSGQLDPSQVLAVTFTTRAAGELATRLRTLGAPRVQARTFHSAALRQLRHFWPTAIGGSMPSVTASKSRLIAEAAGLCRVPTSPPLIRDLAGEIEWAKVSQVVADDYAAAAASANRGIDVAPADVARIMSAYEDAKERAGLIDFEDVLLLTVALLEGEPAVAREVRGRYRFLTVDEYQDVSPLQQRLLDAWLGDQRAVTVVGDAAQTIYSFTGATPQYLHGFRTRYPDAVAVELVRNYRSTPQIVGLANRVLAGTTPAAPSNAPGGAGSLTLVAQRPAGPTPQIHPYDDEVAEARAVVTRIQAQHTAGTAWRDIAVLYRINAQSEAYESALADAGVPYVMRGGERFFDRPEVRQAVTVLRGAARAEMGAAPLLDQVRGALTAVGWSPEPPAGSGAVRERWESLGALIALADEVVASDPAADLPRFVAELEERANAQHAPTVDGVTLASIHAAKGLEWSAVHLVGLVDGTLPLVHATTPEQIAEERRLFYVAITRARDELTLSWAAARAPGGRAFREPSRFVTGLGDSLTGAVRAERAARRSSDSARRSPRGPARCRVCSQPLLNAAARKIGRCDTCEPTYDEALLEALKAWRLEVARETSVPAFVVFTDATLVAIAESLPTDEASLLRIPGVGKAKLERHGSQVLALVEGHR